MDAQSRQRLRDLMQAKLASYHEDANGQPALAPETGMLRLLVPGLPGDTPAVCTLSPEGDLSLRGQGSDGEKELLNLPLSNLCASILEDPAYSDVFELTCRATRSTIATCRARDQLERDQWLIILSRRNVPVFFQQPAE